MRERLAQLQLAVMLLTRLPAGRLPEPAPTIGASLWAFPLAGLAVGGIAAAVLLATIGLGLPPMLAAGLALAAQIVVTGALHEDGLADLADGFWGGRDAARRLEIMRDSRIGSYGALALILGTGLRWQAISALAAEPHRAALALIAVAMIGRLAPVFLLWLLPPARSDGMGRSASGTRPGAVLVAALLCLPCLSLTGLPVALIAAALVTLGLARLARAKIGGQSGDVLGAGQQLAEIALLMGLAARIG